MIRSLTLITLAALSGAVAAERMTANEEIRALRYSSYTGTGRLTVRLGVTALPLGMETGSTGGAVDGEWNSGHRVSLGISQNFDTKSRVAFNIAMGLAFDNFARFTLDGVPGTADVSMSHYGLCLEPGMAVNFTRDVALEVGFPLGIGRSTTSSGASGHYSEYGVLVRPVVAWGDFQTFAELGYLAQKNVFEGGSFIKGAGMTMSLGIGYAF